MSVLRSPTLDDGGPDNRTTASFREGLVQLGWGSSPGAVLMVVGLGELPGGCTNVVGLGVLPGLC